MKQNALLVFCLLAACGCFYSANAARVEAERLLTRAGQTADQALEMQLLDQPRHTAPGMIEEENPWVLDPAETVRKPENRKLLDQSQTEFAAAAVQDTASTVLQSAGHALAGLSVLLLGLATVREALARSEAATTKEAPDGQPAPPA